MIDQSHLLDEEKEEVLKEIEINKEELARLRALL
jgi:DNA-directed RNA polymerase subunit H (RpoH/RPB5)